MLPALDHYAWVATTYLLASTASMPTWGKPSDACARKRFCLVGTIVFVIGSAVCGRSRTMTELILSRALQGGGAGAMLAISQAILGGIFPPAQRARRSGVPMSIFGVATSVGPPLGLSWGGATCPWLSVEVAGLFVFSALMWVASYVREMRAREPVIDPRQFHNDIFTVSAPASALQSAAMFGAVVFLPLFVRGVQGKSATNSGIILMPLMLGAIVTSIGAGRLLARSGRDKAIVIVGLVLTAVGAWPMSRMGGRPRSRSLRTWSSWASAWVSP